MTKKTLVGLTIFALLFCSGFKRNVRPNNNELEREKLENASLRLKIKQLEAANDKVQKETKKSDDTEAALKTKIKNLETTKDQQQAANAVLRSKIEELEATKENQLKEIRKIKKASSTTVARIESQPAIDKDINDEAKVSKAFFGIYPGEKIDELSKRFSVSEINATNEGQSDIKQWSVEPNDPNISKVDVQSYQGYVYQIMVIFNETNKGNFETLKKEYRQDFDEVEYPGLTRLILGEKGDDLVTSIDGRQIMISFFENLGNMGAIITDKNLNDRATNGLGK